MNIFSAGASVTSLTDRTNQQPKVDRGTMKQRWKGLGKFISLFLRLALGVTFLSAVADRFGFWGTYGHTNVSWGNYARFEGYVGKLNWFLPTTVIPALSIIVTIAETLFGILLIIGFKTRLTALLSGVLLMSFGLTMTAALGVKAPLNFSVFSAAGGALLLATCDDFRFSLDELLLYVAKRDRQEAGFTDIGR